MDKPKQYVDAGEMERVMKKALTDFHMSVAIPSLSREAVMVGKLQGFILDRLTTLLTTATPIAPDPRYDALRADVVKVTETMREKHLTSHSDVQAVKQWTATLTAALDAAPADAPATFPEGIPIQVDAELYYRFKGYRENDMAGEPEETFTIYVTPESSFAPPPSPTVPQVPVSVVEDFLIMFDTDQTPSSSRMTLNRELVNAHIKALAPYRKPPPDAPADEPCAHCKGRGYFPQHPDEGDGSCELTCSYCGGKGYHTAEEIAEDEACPDCPPKGEPEPILGLTPEQVQEITTIKQRLERFIGIVSEELGRRDAATDPAPPPPTVEQRARWFIAESVAWNAKNLANALIGERDTEVTDWLREQKEATDAP